MSTGHPTVDVHTPASFFEHATAEPDLPAVVDVDGTVTTSGALLDRVNRGSNALRALGLRAGDRVAIVCPNDVRFLEVALACSQIGVPLVTINWHLTAAEMAHLLADSAARAVVVSGALMPTVAEAVTLSAQPPPVTIGVLGATGVPLWDDLVEQSSPTTPTERVNANVMLYTSGTTGRPKGVVWPSHPVTPEIAVARTAPMMARRGLVRSPGTRTLVVGPLYHGAPFGWAFYGLQLGHTVHLSGAWDSAGFLDTVQRERIQTVQLAPIHFSRLLALAAEVRATVNCSSLAVVSHAGAPTPPAVKRSMIDWWGPVLVEYYAASEGFGTSIDSHDWLAHPGSVGRADGDGATMQVRDEDGTVVGPDEIGTLWVRNPGGVLSSYHNDTAATAASRDADGYYSVGDMARIDAQGWLYLVDRRVDMILSGGVNIYPAEVEQALAGHPAVHEACVVGLPDPQWGQRVVAVCSPAPGFTGSDELTAEVLAAARGRLARFKLPRTVHWRDELPVSDTGKLLRRVVRESLVG